MTLRGLGLAALLLVITFGLPLRSQAAAIDVTATETAPGSWMLQTQFDTPVFSFAIFIVGTDNFTFADGSGTDDATIADSTVSNASGFDVALTAPSVFVDVGGGFSFPDLGPVDTPLRLGTFTAAGMVRVFVGFDPLGVPAGLFADGNPIGSSDIRTVAVLPIDMPEPGALVLLGAGLAGLAFLRRRRETA